MIIDEDVEDFLEHYGVKGMKWGQRRARNRALNKATAKKEWVEQERRVTRARARIDSGKSKADYKKAKAQYKIDKLEVGSRAARRTLAKAKQKRLNELNVAQQAKNKKEAAAILAIVGGALAFQIAGNVARAKALR